MVAEEFCAHGPVRGKVPDDVFTKPYTNPVNDTPEAVRGNLREATRLLREARQAGKQTIGGLEMLVGQALEQFGWWTGRRAPAGVMREAALKRLAEFMRS